MSKNLNTNIDFNNIPEEEDELDIKKVLSNIFNNWLLFLISIVICFALAFLYARYAAPDWHTTAKILVEDQKNNPASAISGSLTGDISSLFHVKSSADNEVQILKTRSLMAAVVSQMQLNIRTYEKGRVKEAEIYDESPFTIGIKYKVDTLTKREFTIRFVDNDHYRIANSDDEIDRNVGFGDTVKLKQYNIVLNRVKPGIIKKDYVIRIEAEDFVADRFSQIFSAALSDKQSTTIDLSFSYPHPKKAEAILNKLMQIYLFNNLQNKKMVADSTMAFINQRIEIVNKDLSSVEEGFQSYKEENDIADIGEQSKALVGSATDFYKKLNEQQVQLSVITDLEKLIAEKKLVPSSLMVPDAVAFGQAVNAYNELLINRDRASASLTPNNPLIKNLNLQIDNARAILVGNVDSYKKTLTSSIAQLQKQDNSVTGKLKQVPKKQRQYLDFARKQQLQQELYLFLLQKKEETAISKTSTISSSRVIDSAKSDFEPYTPKRAVIYLIGLALGLVLPGLYLYVKELLNIRINKKADIEEITFAPIIGEINHNDEEKSLVVTTNSRSVISEQFRSLRTNLQYAIDASKPNVLLFTSSMSGEGKSFLSLNLASALALTDKKVILMELDLRKPKLSENLGLKNNNGFTNYIISKSTDFTKFIQPTWFSENCSLMSSGPIPPNPSELLVNVKLEELIDNLKKEFDYIIIDCAPIGLVTDTLLLEKYADMLFYVVRQDYTYKSQLNIVNDLRLNKKVNNLYIVVNDIKARNGGYASYGQGYGYGYGYSGYGNDAEKKDKKS